MKTTTTNEALGTPAAPPAPTTGLALGIGKKNTLQMVESLAAASALFLALQDQHHRAFGWDRRFADGVVYEIRAGGPKAIAAISQNGRVWDRKKDPLKSEPLYCPYAAGAR